MAWLGADRWVSRLGHSNRPRGGGWGRGRFVWPMAAKVTVRPDRAKGTVPCLWAGESSFIRACRIRPWKDRGVWAH